MEKITREDVAVAMEQMKKAKGEPLTIKPDRVMIPLRAGIDMDVVHRLLASEGWEGVEVEVWL